MDLHLAWKILGGTVNGFTFGMEILDGTVNGFTFGMEDIRWHSKWIYSNIWHGRFIRMAQ